MPRPAAWRELRDEGLETAAPAALPSLQWPAFLVTQLLQPLPYESSNVFARILRGEIPAQFLHEDEHCVAFRDLAPQAPLHVLVVPRKAIATLGDARSNDAALLGHLMLTAVQVAKQLGHPEARFVVNNGAAVGQSVFHLHVHVLAGRAFAWPPG